MSEGEPVLDADHAAFIQGGVSVVVASRDAARVPRVCRAIGCRVSDDRRRVTVYLSAFQGAPLLAAIRSEGVIAVAFNLPSTHRAYQLKGSDARVVPLERALLWYDPAELTGVAFTPAAAFTQTPGPRAGERIGS
jgi:hypothetical protein